MLKGLHQDSTSLPDTTWDHFHFIVIILAWFDCVCPQLGWFMEGTNKRHVFWHALLTSTGLLKQSPPPPTELTKLFLHAEKVILYLLLLSLSLGGDTLQWWKCNSGRFLQLSPLAWQFLSPPPTSFPSERVFSTTGDIYEDKRSNLLDCKCREAMLPVLQPATH